MSIEVKNLTYIYMKGTPFERMALKDVSLTIEENSFTAIAGHTGSGKSTLVQQFNGLLTPTMGQIFVDGVDVLSKKPEAKLAKRKIGMVFQYPEHQLFEETIAADIAFGPRNLGLGEEEIEKRVRDAMTFVQLDYEIYKDRSPFQLSGGQMRRVAIAGVIALQPKYLILDEPTAGLDPVGRADVLKKISELHQHKKITVVMVSHNMDDIAMLAEKVLFMNHGEIIVNATPQVAFKETEKIKQSGLEVPQLTALLQTLRINGLNVDTSIFKLETGVDEIIKAMGRKRLC
ncbi:MAG: energy-coupling factor transporter ATPase [Selenomonadaceae bacterium]